MGEGQNGREQENECKEPWHKAHEHAYAVHEKANAGATRLTEDARTAHAKYPQQEDDAIAAEGREEAEANERMIREGVSCCSDISDGGRGWKRWW